MKSKVIKLTEYGCARCQKWHRKGIDPEYTEHLWFQGKHQGPREREARPSEAFILEMKKPNAV